MNALSPFQETLSFLNSAFGVAPKTCVVLGSGLSEFVDRLDHAKALPREQIPGASQSSVIGHRGTVALGNFAGEKIFVVAGRVHGYEGHSPSEVVHLLRSLRLWGIEDFIITNAAGSTHKAFRPGTLSLISDHMNLTGQNPLVGKETFGHLRFPDMSDAYSKEWRKRVLKRATKIKNVKSGIYAGVLGPSFETGAEIKMLRRLGADLVGMSTVWEVIALHQMKARILGVSLVTNFGTGITPHALTHEEVLDITKARQKSFADLMEVALKVRNK